MKQKVLALYGNRVFYGHERSNIQVFKTLTEGGTDLHILINKKGIAPQAKEILDKNQISYSQICYPDWADMRKPFTTWKVLKYGRKVIKHNLDFLKVHRQYKPDFVYIANDFMYINLIPSFLLINTKIIYRIGDAPVLTWKPFNFLWRNYIVRRTHKFVCISKYILGKVREAGRVTTPKDVIIYNFPPIRLPSKEIPFEKKGLTFSYLGQIFENKGVALFVESAIEICKKYDHVYFTLAGSLLYANEFSQTLLEKVENSGYGDRITFLGSIENIESFFKNTDVLVTPSLKEEPLGNVIVEAKANRTPSIIFKSGGMPELINHLEDGFICAAKTCEGLNEAIEYYASKPEFIAKHGANAYSSIEKLQIEQQSFFTKWNNVFPSK
ncbi:glycosyltransferase family 4 protein [Mangrovibacterium diazotrophicum]|uniref:Glycosyltransferase involved in cell wall biosynthesis n=1 Tax=Mangrovibacterium diazotrophicum TaxID=1261403 RepID=A0A419VWW5_9BACT|nr:glycosyltransferase family 4 protein [Mangrovibacterium diazotrophicum]RKD87717.1 glycosyltransferase involved in cell wall biosynthesis [Mangrovibacterium diazotrophicum]